MKHIILAALIICSSSVALAQDNTEAKVLAPVKISVDQKIRKYDTAFITLPNLMILDRVVLRMKKDFLCFAKTKVEVSFEGSAPQMINVQAGGLLNYVVKSDETTAREIEIRSVEGCGVTVESATILPRVFKPGNTVGHLGQMTNSYVAVSYTYQAFKYLENSVSDQDRISFLSPTLKVLGQALAVLSVVPETSTKAKEALQAVSNQLNADAPFIEKLMSIETTYPVAVEIESVKSQIENMLR